MKKALVNRHGDRNFDKEYFSPRYKKYDEKEFLRTYRSLIAWIRFIERYFPLGRSEGRKVLEVGCGLGGFAKILDERGFDVVASDTSAFIIDNAKRLNPNVEFSVVNIESNANKYKDNEYEIIFAFEVMEHLVNPQKALQNLKGKLKKGGLLIFTTPYRTKRTTSDPTHISVKEPEVWIKLGEKLGFKDLKYKYATFIPFFYRYSTFLSIALPIRTDFPIVGYTCFFSFRK
ncbi:class I SAM-dependent methyltransferase [Candidatus Daviesbacteria bacterium]|nr:class I SAM-dependent methyltransferase [Candidatus Daviesbacteria bacterium]